MDINAERETRVNVAVRRAYETIILDVARQVEKEIEKWEQKGFHATELLLIIEYDVAVKEAKDTDITTITRFMISPKRSKAILFRKFGKVEDL